MPDAVSDGEIVGHARGLASRGGSARFAKSHIDPLFTSHFVLRVFQWQHAVITQPVHTAPYRNVPMHEPESPARIGAAMAAEEEH